MSNKQFVGYWKLRSMHFAEPSEMILNAGAPYGLRNDVGFHPWGISVDGRLCYSEDGDVVTILGRQGRPPASSPFVPLWTPDEALALVKECTSYFGTYLVDPTVQLVHHDVRFSLNTAEPSRLSRKYAFIDGQLILTAPTLFGELSLIWGRSTP
ncbi:MAG: lipocalin-like domain-containing protein [Polyangiaceae bacterium]|nr:lipocalin-like domain-containing protein [Polyangiaceae bacterium]